MKRKEGRKEEAPPRLSVYVLYIGISVVLDTFFVLIDFIIHESVSADTLLGLLSRLII